VTKRPGHKRVIAFDIRPRSFGFVVFEGSSELLDFGVRSFRGGMNAVQVSPGQKIAALIDEFRPHAFVLEDRASRRTNWTSMVTGVLEHEAKKRRISVVSISRVNVRKAFVGRDGNKYEIASALAQQIPTLASKLPPKRKCWESEDYRMSIFDAAALAVAYFGLP
jgi:hypothetical protein